MLDMRTGYRVARLDLRLNAEAKREREREERKNNREKLAKIVLKLEFSDEWG